MGEFGNAKSRRSDSKATLSVSRGDAQRHLQDDRNASRGAAESQRDTAAHVNQGHSMPRRNVAWTLANENRDQEAQSLRDESAVPAAEPEAAGVALPSVAGSALCAWFKSFAPDFVPDGLRLKASEVASVLHGSGLRWCSSHPMPHSEHDRSGPKRWPEAVGRSMDSARFKRPVSPEFVDP